MFHPHHYNNNWTDTLTAIGTLAAVLTTIFFFFLERLKKYLNRPILNIGINLKPPDCHKIIGSFNSTLAEAYWFRLFVENKGKSNAQNLEVLIEKVEAKKDGKWEIYPAFLPSNLKWTHIDVPVLLNLQRGTKKNVDFGYIYDPKANISSAITNNLSSQNSKIEILFNVSISVLPFTGYHVLKEGEYKFHIIVGASNCKPQREKFRVKFNKDWHTDEAKMLSKNIEISKIK